MLRADLSGYDIVQRTSAAPVGWCKPLLPAAAGVPSLVCASATAAAVDASRLGEPSYVITGWFDADHPGEEDVQTAG